MAGFKPNPTGARGRDKYTYRDTSFGGLFLVGFGDSDQPYSAVQAPVDLLYVAPLIVGDVDKTVKNIRVGINLGGTAGQKGRVGIYENADDEALAPGALLADYGEIALDGVPGSNPVSGDLPTVLAKNKLYWVGIVIAGAVLNASLRAFDNYQAINLFGVDPGDSFQVAAHRFGLKQTHAYGALIDPAPVAGRATIFAQEMPALGVVFQ